VNASAAFHKYGGPCVVVDLGTSIISTFVSEAGEFLGRNDLSGIGMAITGCFQNCAVAMVEFREPEKVIGTNTVGSINRDCTYASSAMIDGLLERVMRVGDPTPERSPPAGQASLIVTDVEVHSANSTRT